MPQGARTLRPRGRAGVADREYEARRREQEWRAWYKTARWVRLRAAQLNTEPLCRMCFAADRIEGATVCDHVEPHRGDPVKFWDGPFQSLCQTCHNVAKQRDERGGVYQKSAAPPL